MSELSPEPQAGAAAIEALLEKVQAGDREAFMTITRLYQRKVFVLAYSILRDREDALDAVQETFLRLYQKAGLYRPGNSFQGWLLQMAKNISIDHYRRNRKKKQEWETTTPVEEMPLAAGPAREGDSAAADLRQAFARSVESLAERQKMVFIMRHYNELQFNEISEAMKISIGTAKSLHFKAVQNLRKRLAPVLGIGS
ncbi:MAG TPA: sigma-70 family RNA polymerase sigma factor [Candidatus Aminicenantes bacterium]|nr:sigma-70 family RNA polymerase sigma factor [Candidatus Aminicenantes bacterium]HRY65054.1 sigma-70 family RNA polymerase sigma factor [Candidatus Aminicenantes bacterium]HRZ71967.1 sigma-70 family RNA polymerase sigma factor [Candidatus Aminicenantes bacterium]